ncbi:OmpA family protein [Bacteroidota bacterium]
MKKHILIFSFLLVVFIPTNIFAQKDRQKIADETFAMGEYHSAIDKYKKARTKAKDKEVKDAMTFKLALCYRLTNNTALAESWFKNCVARKYPDPLATLYLAEAYKMNEKYDKAIIEFENYQKLVPEDIRGEQGVQSCINALEWINNPERYLVENVKEFNTRSSDFSPSYASEDNSLIYFTSSRESADGKKLHGVTGQGFADIFESKLDRKGKWSEPTPIDKLINSQYDDGASSLNPSATTMYFTRCRFDKAKNLGCQIFESKKSGKEWGDPTLIPLTIDSLVAAHPSVSSDELVMLFTGNLPGSIGGNDIWRVERSSTSSPWGSPVNLGSTINTIGNEMYPFYLNDSVFYFSSNGHPGMGGLDIYKGFKSEEGEWVVENMKVPINSASDDFGIVFKPGKQEMGFFTSGRSDGKGSDDIYSFVLPLKEFKVHGLVIDEKTEEYIEGADVKLIGSDGTNLEMKTEKTGAYSFDLNPDTDYIVVAIKEKYLNAKVRETTIGFDENTDFTANLVLAPIENPIVLPNIHYEFSKWELRPESMVELDKLVETLSDNPNIIIELSAHTDARGGINFDNMELSQRRAQSVVDYLISKNIASDRLEAKGYAATVPKVIDAKIAKEKDFLNEEDVLDEEFINNLADSTAQEYAHQLNRRTEFMVISTTYVAKPVEEMITDELMGDDQNKINIDRDFVKTKSEEAELLELSKQREAINKNKTTGEKGNVSGAKKIKKEGIKSETVKKGENKTKKNTEKEIIK